MTDPIPNLTALLATFRPPLPLDEDGDPYDPVAMYFGPNLRELADPIGVDGRCGAAHVDDPDPCGGPVVVMVVDQDKAGARGCEHHGARLLASLDHGSVYGLPDAPMGTAVRVFKAAREIPPFVWLLEPTQPAACGRCKRTFDPSDTRFDGQARQRNTPWCRSCVDRCHESSADHACPVCDPTRRR